MPKFAVAHTNLYENTTVVEIVKANSWHEALEEAFPGYVENLNIDNMEDAKEEAFNQDWMFDVKEIK